MWVDHLRHGSAALTDALNQAQVLTHPFVIGELACGNLKNRSEVLENLANLPQAPVADHTEVLHLIDHYQLMGRGVGYIDIHLLASARLAESTLEYQPLMDEQSSAPIRVAYERRNRDLDPQLLFMSPAERQQRSHANKALQRNLHRAKDPSGIIAVETVPVVTKLVDLRRALALSRLVSQR